MPESKDHQKSAYPLPVYNYRVTVDSDTISFSEVSGLSVEYDPVTYKHGLSFVMGEKIIPGMRQPTKLTMKKGIVRGNSFLHTWLKDVYANPLSSNNKRDIQIDLCDENGASVVRWTVKNAMPVKLDAPGFDANSNEVAIESMDFIGHDLSIDFQLT